MKWVFCRDGDTYPQRVTVQRYNEAGEPVAVIHNFPAEVCKVCREEYYAAKDWQKVEDLLKEASLKVTQVPVYELRPE